MKRTTNFDLLSRKFLILTLLFFTYNTQAQSTANNWVNEMIKEGANFEETKSAFYTEWQGKTYSKGHGWKQFHRWESFWETRLMTDGSFPNFKEAYQNFNQYKNSFAKTKVANNGGNWTPIGPFTHTNSDSWSPGQGRVNFISQDPSNSNTIFLGTPAGGVWKSVDSGSNWTPLGDDLAVMGVSGIAISHSNSNTIYLSTGDADGGDTYSIGVLKSVDGGLSWNVAGNLAGNLKDIVIDPSNDNIVYVCSQNGVYKTTNGGANWSQVLNGSYRDLELKPNSPQTIYAASQSQVYYSNNGGANWGNAGGLPSGSSRIALAVTPANDSYVYLLIANSNGAYEGVYRSQNSGVSFSARNTNTDVFNGSTQSWYDMTICVSDVDADIVMTGCLNVWKSTSGGSSFSQVNNWSSPNGSAYTHADIHFLRYYDGNFYCGSDGGIYRSTNDASSFTNLTDGLQISQFYRISGSPNDGTTIAGGLQDNGGYVWNNSSWKNYYGADGMEAAVDHTNSDNIYGMIQNGTMYLSTNAGATNQSAGRPQGEVGRWVTPMQLTNDGSRIIAGYDNLYEFNGAWNQLSTYNFPEKLRNIELYDANTNVMFLSTNSSIYRTNNNGVNVVNITNNLTNVLNGNVITSIEVDPADSNRIWVSIGGWTSGAKVAFTSNGGQNWSNVSGTLPNLPCNIVKYEAGSSLSNAIYIGMDIGVYYQDDNIGDFVPYMVNLPNVIVRDLELNEVNGVIRAGTYGRGVWESGVYSTTTNANDAGITSIINPSSSFCGETFTPIVKLKNFGSDDLLQIDILYQIDNGTISTLNWTGNLIAFNSENVTLPSVTAGGTHTFKAWTNSPNGLLDEDLSNDSTLLDYTGIVNGHMITTMISEDCWGSETTWDIVSSTGDTLLSGGPYVDGNASNINTDSTCANSGCYEFIINDVYGDGIAGASDQSCGTDGSYSVLNDNGGILIQMTDASFGSQAIHPFCVGVVADTADFNTSNSSICEGESSVFTDNSYNATSYLWDFGMNASPSTATGIGPHMVTYSSSGSKDVSLIINGGTDTSTQVITVNASPVQPTFTVNGSTTFCAGESVILTSSENSGNLWSTSETTQSIVIVNSGSYTLTHTNANNCSATSTPIVVVVNSLPLISQGTTVDPASCISPTGSIEVAGSDSGTLSWSGASSGSMNVTLPYVISNLNAGNISITFSNQNGCVAQQLSIDLVGPTTPVAPVISNSSSLEFCDGGSVVLTSSSSSSSSNIWSSNQNSQSITVTTAGIYSVYYTDANNCPSALAFVDVIVHSTPATPVISTSGSVTICDGESVTLSSPLASGNSWSNGESTQDITVTSTSDNTLTITDANGCSSSSLPMTVTVNPFPAVPTITANGSVNICDGETVSLTSSATTGNVWSSNETTQSIPVAISGSYTTTVSIGSCSVTSQPFVVVVNPLPIVTFNLSDTLCINSAAYTFSQGMPSGGNYIGTGVTNGSFDAQSVGIGTYGITYVYSNSLGCEASTVSQIVVDGCASIDESEMSNIVLFPNPANNELNVSLDGSFKFRMLDSKGKLILFGEATNTTKINLEEFKSGMYFIIVESNERTKSFKVIRK